MNAQEWARRIEDVSKQVSSSEIESAPDAEALEALRLRFLGRRGSLTAALKLIKDFSLEERRALAPQAQRLKARLEELIQKRAAELADQADVAVSDSLNADPSLPPFFPPRGRLHPLTLIERRATRILSRMGFSRVEGPLIETDENNFTALNIPEHHPSRDALDTFYLSGSDRLLRTHTSPVQIRAMRAQEPPIRVMAPGRVFRHEAVDATHSAVFHQIEGFSVDRGTDFAELKGTLESFLKALFGPRARLRFRPSYFPFTEPSAEVDVSCLFCSGSGCAVCKRSGFIEILGAGLIHPNVLKAVGYDPAIWSGFAFGLGLERVAMLEWGIKDIRLFYENDRRFLAQFDDFDAAGPLR